MKYKCCIFDLDGTLVNSIHALTYCTNLALEKFGLGPLTEDQMKTIVGDGYKMQMKRALLLAGDEALSHYEEILPIYMEIFSKTPFTVSSAWACGLLETMPRPRPQDFA